MRPVLEILGTLSLFGILVFVLAWLQYRLDYARAASRRDGHGFFDAGPPEPTAGMGELCARRTCGEGHPFPASCTCLCHAGARGVAGLGAISCQNPIPDPVGAKTAPHVAPGSPNGATPATTLSPKSEHIRQRRSP